ncbi:alpha/beta fold hydrolase [Xylophilus rhododendri]|uniref:Alpha/beta fold hydrolase n=1 Tax=Xylophilus rhododendri TaxID=2697032 RepID=A0A857J173_9BURK|nr:alpha/beta hydrolase [Xylophilus rhododendri]QHI97003.1 alpha/beta fold hydrolase [Xylophilus rhododendri]
MTSQPVLRFVDCPGAPGAPRGEQPAGAGHRMAYWEWNETGDAHHPHVVLCVHGLTRQGRDFDELARRLAGRARVICPDVVGRGHSDWLQDPAGYGVPLYAFDMLGLLTALHAEAPIATLDWVGTSMGGLIGIALCGQTGLPLPAPVRKLVLNDVGPVLEWPALERIGQYLGRPLRFATVEEGAAALWLLSSSFGPHSPEAWHALSEPMLRPAPEGGFGLHYDPAIAQAFKAMTPESAAQSEAQLWSLYDAIQADTLVLRGADSDLLTVASVVAMAGRGPKASAIEFAGVGHAPTLVDEAQSRVVADFLFGPAG